MSACEILKSEGITLKVIGDELSLLQQWRNCLN